MANKSRSVARARRHSRVRKDLTGSVQRPRLNVFRSLSGIYAQVIDDQAGHTLASASTVDRDLREQQQADHARLGKRQVFLPAGGSAEPGRRRADRRQLHLRHVLGQRRRRQ